MQVIYIPGLGDDKVTQTLSAQRLAVTTWRFHGVTPHLFQMKWSDTESFELKLDRLLKLIDELSLKDKVALVCASAGATAALNAFAERRDVVVGVVCIAGKINNPQAIGSGYKQRNPSFWESAQQTNQSVSKLAASDRQRVLSIRAMFDEIVPAKDSIFEGAHNKRVGTSGHAITIITQLLFGAPAFLSFLKQVAKS
ncbi:hypothetical protein BH09PAT3_BH09PAT3_4350 [soil metagenome]